MNKMARIASIWVGMVVIMMVIGVIRICCREGALDFCTFFTKNIKNTIFIALHITVQDLAFFCAANYYNPVTTSTSGIVYLMLSILITIFVFLALVWMLTCA